MVQLSSLLISAVRHKFFAVLIGPAGYGILSFLYSGFDLVKQATSFGIDVSGVKKISENTDESARFKMAALLIKLSILTGLFGTVVFAALSYYLSMWSFGNSGKTLAIILISVAILFRQVISAQNAVMQGCGRLRFLAKTNIFGNLFGLIFSLPLFIFWRIDAILPSILISAVISFLVSHFYYNKMGLEHYKISFSQAVTNGRDVLFFGGLISINAFLPVLSNYLIQLFINDVSGVSYVGYFNTGQLIINSYVGIIFSAMAMEYYPRLASYNKDVKKEQTAVSQQAVISVLIMVPIIILFLEFLPGLVTLLFSSKFQAAVPMLSWCILAMFFKSVSWCMGYVIISRADSKVFMKTSFIFNILYILLCAGGFYIGGLRGLGIGFLLYYLIHLIAVFIIVKLRYKLEFDIYFYRFVLYGTAICLLLCLTNELTEGMLRHSLFLSLFLFCMWFSVNEINKRVPIKDFVINFLNKKRQNGNKE